MNKTFFSILLLAVAGYVGYTFYYQSDCSSCHKHATEQCCSAEETASHASISLNTLEDLQGMLDQSRPAVIKVYLDGCPPCKQAAAVYPEIVTEFPGIAFYDLNVANIEVMNALLEKNVIDSPVTAAPTFLLIKDGKTVEVLQGFNGKEGLVSSIASALR